MRSQAEITQILQKVKEGSSEAYDQLFPLVYDQLKSIAFKKMKNERKDHTLSHTELVHEVYLKLVDQTNIDWKDRAHFFAMASQCMRQILIDYARKKKADKRGGNKEPVTFIDTLMKVDRQADDLINLDSALQDLAKLNERLAEVVEYRYFGEMSIKDTAEVMNLSVSTVKRDWAKARGWLYKELKGRFN
ncbi:MAG TPA: sigma-70 family RNA polymerase sigma factor [Balneolaceae bacterium]|nr:sigma-70 family RNA polymerase sigma factor [Balneolaceae bacterium]